MKNIAFIFLCIFNIIVHSQQSVIDSLKQQIASHKKKDTILINLYTQLGNELIDNKIPEQALDCGEKAKSLSIKLKYVKGQLNALNVLAKYYQNTKEFTKGIEYFEKYIVLSDKNSIKEGVMLGNNNIGILYYDKGDYSKSLKHHFIALALAEKHNSLKNIPIYYSNAARVYYASNQYEKAIEYTEKALKIEEDNGASPKAIMIRSINLSAYYTDFGHPAKTVELLGRMLILNESTLQHPLYASYMYANLGDAFIKLENYRRAIDMIRKAYPVFQKSDRMRAQLDLSLANAYSNLGEKNLGTKYLNAGLTVAKESKEPEFERFAYETASLVYKNGSDFKKALNYHEMASTLKDSLLNVEQSDKIVAMQILFETQQKEDSIALQQIELRNEQIERGKTLAISDKNESMLKISLIALVIVCILSVIVFRLYKRAKDQKQKIEQKNKENELLLGEIHHRVKNNLQVVSSLLSLQERNMTDKTAKAAILEGKERVQSMGLIHKLLYQKNNFSGIEMNDYIEKLVMGLLNTFGKKEDDFELNLNFDKIILDVDTAIPLGLIINELVVNSLKYAYNKTKEPMLKIKLQEVSNQLILEVKDNGSGVISEIEASKSFGMKLIKSLSRQLSGVIDLEQEKGLCFKIAINDYKLLN